MEVRRLFTQVKLIVDEGRRFQAHVVQGSLLYVAASFRLVDLIDGIGVQIQEIHRCLLKHSSSRDVLPSR